VLLLRDAEQRTGIVARMAAAPRDRRDPTRIVHQLRDIIVARVFGICCRYEDGIDHNALRTDPALKMAVGRCPELDAAMLRGIPPDGRHVFVA
jgi:hypothetical protein